MDRSRGVSGLALTFFLAVPLSGRPALAPPLKKRDSRLPPDLAAPFFFFSLALPLPLLESKALARLSAEALLTGQEKVTNLAARLGISEGRIEAAQSRNAADLLAHEMAQADLIRSDPERLAMELEAVQTNLETVFAITARLSRLSLTDFLR